MALSSSTQKPGILGAEMEEAAGERKPLVDSPGLKRDALVSVLFAGLAGILLGYDVGMVAGVLDPIHDFYGIGDRRTELFVGSLNAMAFLGCFIISPLADRYGRRSALGAAAALFFVGNTLQALSWSYPVLLVGRALAGVAVGFTLILAPLYTAEVSPARVRGALTTLMEISFNLGIVWGFFLTWSLQESDQVVAWRIVMGIGSIPAIILGVGACFFLTESPRWLVAQGRLGEAQAVLDKLVEPDEGARMLEQLTAATSSEDPTGSWRDLFSEPQFSYPLLLGCTVAFFSQASGIESIQYYSVHILQTEFGFARDATLLFALWMGIAKLACILVATYLVDRAGRRPLFMISGLGCALSMAILSASSDTPQSPMQLVGMVLFVASFSIGYGPLLYVFNGEIFPQSVRSKGISVAMSTARFMSASVSLSFLSLISLVTLSGAWAIFGAMALMSVFFVFFCLPETRGKTLEEAL